MGSRKITAFATLLTLFAFAGVSHAAQDDAGRSAPGRDKQSAAESREADKKEESVRQIRLSVSGGSPSTQYFEFKTSSR